MTRFLTETEVSEFTRISLGTLRRWRLENKGPKFHKFGSLVRYAEEDLTSWGGMRSRAAAAIQAAFNRPRRSPILTSESRGRLPEQGTTNAVLRAASKKESQILDFNSNMY
jgi:predicted DNA-binding transcriptional regulator AlpA